MKTPAQARMKCRGRIYILFKLILNIKAVGENRGESNAVRK